MAYVCSVMKYEVPCGRQIIEEEGTCFDVRRFKCPALCATGAPFEL